MKNFAFLSFAFDLERCFHTVEEIYTFDDLDNVRQAFNNYGAGRVISYFEESSFKTIRVVIVDNCKANGVVSIIDNAVIISIRSWINVESFVNLLAKHLKAVESIHNKGNEIIITF